MRTSIASALVLALSLPPGAAHAGDWSAEQKAAMQQIITLRNGGALDEAVTLAQQEFTRADASKGFRRAVAREGKAAAIKVFERDRASPRAAVAVAALCVAVDLMRAYQADLMESENDRLKIPAEVMRLEALATTAAAPCAPSSAPAAPPPQPPLVAVEKPAPALGVSTSPPPLASPPVDRADRRRFRAGLGTLIPGLLLFAPMAGLLAYRGDGERELAAIRVDTKNGTPTPKQDQDAAALGQRYTATTAGTVALGVTGAALVVTGAALLATGARQHRMAVAPWGGHGVGGLVLQGRF
ncbi:MAG TPA: hypothetical protein VGB85_05610 [Nannocystis sp.]